MPEETLKSRRLEVGVGYRSAFRDTFFSTEKPEVSWIEVISENYLPHQGRETRARQSLRRLRLDFPVAMHGVGLNLASSDPLDERYLGLLIELEREIEPWLVTDHLCWTGVGRENLFDLLPFPYTEASLRHLEGRVQYVQDRLRRPIALENLTFYLSAAGSEMAEVDFLNELSERTGCRLLLDVNNVYVNSVNFGFDPLSVLRRVRFDRVAEIHLAGHSEGRGGLLIDTHGSPVKEDVWDLYEWVFRFAGPIPTMIERDQNIPAWSEMEQELRRLRAIFGERGRHESFAARMAEPIS